jgi:hypothetical protein
VILPDHGDVWVDLGDDVPRVPSAAIDDDYEAARTSTVLFSADEYSDKGTLKVIYVGVTRQERGLPVSRASGESALVGAARRGATEAVRALLGAGATVDVASAPGETALDTATANGQLGAALALVSAGATVSRTDDKLMRVATQRGDDELVGLLLRAAAPPLLPQPSTLGEPKLLVDEEEPGATSCLLLAARHPMTIILDTYLDFFTISDSKALLEAPHGARHVTVRSIK